MLGVPSCRRPPVAWNRFGEVLEWKIGSRREIPAIPNQVPLVATRKHAKAISDQVSRRCVGARYASSTNFSCYDATELSDRS